MAAGTPAMPPVGNPCCCVEWQVKYAAMKIRRDALKQMVRLLEKACGEKQAEIDRLNQSMQEENQEESVSKDFEKESVARAALEKEVFNLKSEISSLQQRLERNLGAKNERVKLLQDHASGGEKGVGRPKNLPEEKKFLTRTVWWEAPVIWLPVVFWCISTSVRMGHTLPEIAAVVASGIFIWTLIEYTLHRFLFHMKTKSHCCVSLVSHSHQDSLLNSGIMIFWRKCFRGNAMHFLLHGCHHKHPMDSLRLVFPPAAAAILCVLAHSLIRSSIFTVVSDLIIAVPRKPLIVLISCGSSGTL